MFGPKEMVKLERFYSEIMEWWWRRWSEPPYTCVPGMETTASGATVAEAFDDFEPPLPPQFAYTLTREIREIRQAERLPVYLFEGLIDGYVGDRSRMIDRRLYARLGGWIKGALAQDMLDVVEHFERRADRNDPTERRADFPTLLKALDHCGICHHYLDYELFSTFARTMGLLLDWFECTGVGLDECGRLPSFAEAMRSAEAWRSCSKFGDHLLWSPFVRFADGRAIHWVGSVEARVRLGHFLGQALPRGVWPWWEDKAALDPFVLCGVDGEPEMAFVIDHFGETEPIWSLIDVEDKSIRDHLDVCSIALLVVDHELSIGREEVRLAHLTGGIADGTYRTTISTNYDDDVETLILNRKLDVTFEDGRIKRKDRDEVIPFRVWPLGGDEEEDECR